MNILAFYAIAAGDTFAGLSRRWGPWSRASVILHVIYAATNVFLILFRITSLTSAGRRAGELALINLIIPLSATHRSFLADLLGIKWNTYCGIHRATGRMTIILLSFHIIAMVQDQQFSFPLDQSRNMFTLIGAASLGILALCTNAWLRHQILTATFVYGTLRHLSNENASSKLSLWVALGILGLTTCLQLVILLYRNGLFAGRGAPRALVSFTFKKTKENKLVVTASQIRDLLPRPVQTHPFTVTSWARHRQDAMELLVQPRRGLSADLIRHASVATETSVSYMALSTGPHGTTEDVSKYENALLIASGFGIAAILNVSIYVRNGLAHNKVPFGEHETFCLYQGTPNYESIVSLEASGDQIERLPNIREERGRTLVVVSAGDDIRDHIREIVREYFHQGVHLSELEYQPNDG
ncbi:cell surface metalloreductase [Aspergillus niger ATCC 13496]|uniref:Cell surface metalloreductase n=1 Tax=Aspergillus niger ATCC 13496 TaxID=1353008 RepID=A0A370BJC3_ASPNG|nr:cell surface metalloreductase [Aspergillus niger ATCC 13496]